MISILTEPKWFQGSLLDMQAAHETVQTLDARPAILRKDFIIDAYQLLEARAHGADCVLLIVAILRPEELNYLLGVCDFALMHVIQSSPLTDSAALVYACAGNDCSG